MTEPAGGRAEWIRGRTFAHRGLHKKGVPENSRTAFAAAIQGDLGIECDVQASGDWQAVVFHDWELDRLTAESGALLERNAAELAAIALAENGDTIQSLTDFLDQIAGRAPLLIEIKSRRGFAVERLCAAVAERLAGYRGEAAIMSFDPRAPRWFALNAPQVVRGLVVTEEGERGWRGSWKRGAALRHSRAEFLAYDIRDLPSVFATGQRAKGIPVASWTVRSLELAHRAALHADAPIAEGAGLS